MPPAIPEAVQLIDAQILHHLALVQDLKIQRNALLPISQLPAEVLGKIFRKFRGPHIHGLDNDGYIWTTHCFDEPCSKWIAVSHVSRHWRSVAIADASLWTNLPLKNPKLTMMMLDRSRLARIPAITLKVDELDELVVAALQPHIPRVFSLVIPNMARETLEQVLTSLPSTAPQLQALSINSMIKVTYGDYNYVSAQRSFHPQFDEALVLPDNILCHTPKLRCLQLNNITIKSDSPLLSHLTNLSLSGIPEKSKPTPHQFRSMLASAPYLKRLDLTGVCPQRPMAAPVLMEHLEYLEINETIPRLVSFFTNFSATNFLKGIHIRVNYVEGSSEDLSRLFDALDQPYVHTVIGTSTDVRRLEICRPGGTFLIRALKLSALERNLEPDKRDSRFDDFNSLFICIKTGAEEMEELDEDLMTETTDMIISDVFDNFTWTGLSELQLSDLDYASPRVLASTFGTISQLRVIAAHDDTAPLLIKALNHHSNAQSNSSGALLLPFSGLRHIDMGRTYLTQGASDFEALRTYVQQRYKCGSPIISLKLDHSRLAMADDVVVLLKKYVEHIIVRPAGGIHEAVDNYSPYNHDWYI